MTNEKEKWDGYLTPDDMREWLERERKALARGFDLRLREATAFVTRYANGEIEKGEAEELYNQHRKRWGPPIPFLEASESELLSDSEISDEIDKGLERQRLAARRRLDRSTER